MLLFDASVTPNTYHVAELVPDDTGIIVRRKKITFLRGASGSSHPESLWGIGGDGNHIWISTNRIRLPPDVPSSQIEGRVYELSPIDFAIRRQVRITATRGVYDIDGDGDVVYVGISIPRPGYLLWKLDADTLAVTRTRSIGSHRALSVAGDKDGCWTGDWRANQIKQWTPSLEHIRSLPWPLTDEGHSGIDMGGSSTRLYINSTVEGTTEDWSAGRYTLTADAQQLENGSYRVLRGYGPWNSGWGSIALGGM